jgi:uncharacterized protein YcfJ
VANLERHGFNDRASSAVVDRGTWQVCEDARFGGDCVVLRPGEYRSLGAMGLNNMVSSVRPVDRIAEYGAPRPAYEGSAPAYDASRPVYQDEGAPPVYDAPPPAHGLWYDVPVSSVHAVVGPPEQRCWVERQQAGGSNNVPGAIVGGVIGGLLGHQIGAGRGNTVATIGGAVAGAAVGNNVGSGGHVQDVERCAAAPRDARPDYWDVTYYFNGVEHHVQMSSPPGNTLTVDANGNPRS